MGRMMWSYVLHGWHYNMTTSRRRTTQGATEEVFLTKTTAMVVFVLIFLSGKDKDYEDDYYDYMGRRMGSKVYVGICCLRFLCVASFTVKMNKEAAAQEKSSRLWWDINYLYNVLRVLVDRYKQRKRQLTHGRVVL